VQHFFCRDIYIYFSQKCCLSNDLVFILLYFTSPHPNGTTLATSGLDNTLRLWDIRNLGSSTSGSDSKKAKAFSSWQCGKSINSAFFSPSGTKLLCTTMANTIDIINEAHLQTGIFSSMQHFRRIRHDNHTGRWLTTFQAQWHPLASEDLFVIGSMERPRRIEVFDGSSGNLIRGIEGDAMNSVSSRCCFHSSQEKLIVCGGNSSGRLIICR
jgi:WD40 repeat protein